jgi:hypothetical protein
MTPRPRQEEAIEPVRTALRRRAEERAGAIVRQARDAASAMIDQAAQDAARAAALAADDARAQAALVASARLGASRRSAREHLLGSDLATYQYLAGRIRDAVLGLRSAPDYPALQARLARFAAAAAGAGALVTEPPDGGAVAMVAGVTVDCSLRRLADRAIGTLGPGLNALCQRPGREAGP